MALVKLDQVTKVYGNGASQVVALQQVSVTMVAREFTAFSGPSGSGKTTLLNLVGCLDQPTDGHIFLEDQHIETLSAKQRAFLRAKRIGFIFQSFNLIPVLTALENVELALQLADYRTADRQQRSIQALENVGLGSILNRYPNQLSGGQQQRVAIARALVKQPALVVADEPTANLDSVTGQQVLDVMRMMNAKFGVTFLFSTHDPQVIEYASRVVTLRDGRIVSDDQRKPVCVS